MVFSEASRARLTQVGKYLCQGHPASPVASGTALARCFPGGRRCDVRRPKRPRAALSRTRGIHSARSTLRIEKNTIAVFEFNETLADSDCSNKPAFELRHVDFDHTGQRLDFCAIDPNKARRARAAAAASGALELQSATIPWLAHDTISSSLGAFKSRAISGIRP